MSTASLSALGVRVRLAADDPGRLEALLDRVPRGWIDGAAVTPAPDCRLRWTRQDPGAPSRLFLDGRAVVTASRSRDLLDRFEHELTAAVAARTRLVVLHAGVVVHRGKAILLPGRSFAGKSTLVHALVAAGATYYSDDLAPLDAEARVHAVPKRLALRRAARRAATVDASRLGWDPTCRPRPVSLVLIARYRPSAAFAPRRLSPGRGALALFGHAITAEAAPESAFRTLAGLAARAPILAADRGEAAASAAAILAAAER